MIGLVLAAGAGRRLHPDTEAVPTALLPVHGEATILDIALRNLAAVGLADVVVVTGFAAAAVADRVAALQRDHGVRLELVHNDRAGEWHSAYSLWLAREYFGRGALLVSGDTVHPVSVPKALLAAHGTEAGQAADLIVAVDDVRLPAGRAVKVTLSARGLVSRISRQVSPADAYGSYAGAALAPPAAAVALGYALESTWRRDPGLSYPDGFQELSDHGGDVTVAPVGAAEWVAVADHQDLRRAREIAGRC